MDSEYILYTLVAFENTNFPNMEYHYIFKNVHTLIETIASLNYSLKTSHTKIDLKSDNKRIYSKFYNDAE